MKNPKNMRSFYDDVVYLKLVILYASMDLPTRHLDRDLTAAIPHDVHDT